MSPRRASPERQKRIERIADELRAAIQREPLLQRFPSERELAAFYNVTAREARTALKLLAEWGWARATRSGYRAVRKSVATPPVQQIVFIQSADRAGPFMSFVARGADEQCRRVGLVMQGRWVEDADRDKQFTRLERELSGLHIGWLLYEKPSDDVLRRWLAAGRRFVQLNSVSRGVSAPSVILDHVGAARLAANHLLELGHQRIALVHRKENTSPVREGVRQVFAQYGRQCSPEHDLLLQVEAKSARSEIDAQIRCWLDGLRRLPTARRPTAAIAYNRTWAGILMTVCWQAGVSVPKDLSIVALGSKYGNVEENEHITLACAGLGERMGADAVELIRELGPADEPPVVVLDSWLELPEATTGLAPD